MIKRTNRCGLSLMEVVLAIAILGGSMAVIGQLLRLGSRNAAMARDLTLAQLYCETKVNEILVGTIVPEAISDVELDETSAKGEWLYKIDVLGTETPGVIAVNVTVGQNPNIITRPVSFSISRLMVEPQMVQELAAQDTALKQAFADAKTAAEGEMSGTVAYTANSGGGAAGGAGGGGGVGGGQGGGDRRRRVSDGEDGGRGRGRDGEDGGQGRGRDGGEDGGRRGRGGEDDGGKRRPGPTDGQPQDRFRPKGPTGPDNNPMPRQFKTKG